MEAVFLDVVNLSVTASWVIAVVLVLRLLLKPAPKKYVCLLWLVVLFRLLCPVALETDFSLVPQHPAVRPEIVYTTPQVRTAVEPVDQIADATLNPLLAQNSAPAPQTSVNPLQIYLFLAACLWVLGMAALCGYTLFSWLRLRRQLREAVPDGEGVYLCSAIASPFVFGLMKPRIYLPFGLADEERQWVLLHERSHIVRGDFLLKPLFWLAVILHWMNPLAWAAWHCYSRDVELACDERAIGSLNEGQRRSYSHTLLRLAAPSRWTCPVAFGNHNVKGRIQHVLCYRRATVGVAAVVLAVILMMTAALGSDPVAVHGLGDLRPELCSDNIDHAALQWGSAIAEVRGAEQLQALQEQLAALPVQQKGRSDSQSMLAADQVAAYNRISFYNENGETVATVLLSGDCSRIEPSGAEAEHCGYLAVQEPQQLLSVLQQTCMPVRQALADTTFLTYLSETGTEDAVVVDVSRWETDGQADLAVYTDKGHVLFGATLALAHGGWGNYFLCEQEGETYLLQFNPTIYQGHAAYSWQLLQFDARGRMRAVETDHVEFSLNPARSGEEQHFDPEEINRFLTRLDGLLQQSTLLLAVDQGELRYSTADAPKTLTVGDYVDWWLADAEDLQYMETEQRNALPLLEKLELKQQELFSDGLQKHFQELADQWAQTFADRDGAGRYEMMTAELQQQIDSVTMEDSFAYWMPVWVSGDGGKKGMFLRGSSPWVDNWELSLPAERNEEDPHGSYTASILYHMSDSGQQAYCYEETLRFAEEAGVWKVADCQITAELMSAEIYEQAEQIRLQLVNGHDTWRLEQEQVAQSFLHDYLQVSDGTLGPWQADTQSFSYTTADRAYTVYLYQPLRPMLQPEYSFWAVRAYGWRDLGEDGAEAAQQVKQDISFDSWASLHVRP